MSQIVEMVPVYYANRKPGRGRADGFITREQARDFKALDLGDWANAKCKSFVLSRKEHEMPRPAQSCIMGANVTIRAAEGSVYHKSLVDGWAPFLRAA